MQTPKTGDVFADRYELFDVLGSGEDATVFLARDRHAERDVALKIFASAESVTAARFEREAAVLAGMRSRFVVRMLDHGVAQGRPYLAMERLGGIGLQQHLKHEERLASDDVITILSQLLSALREAHDGGLLHRDVNPTNIRVVSTPMHRLSIKLFDFGLVRLVDDNLPRLTAPGTIVGSHPYAAPEQLVGGPLTAASDLYSVGLIGYELLLGIGQLPEPRERLNPRFRLNLQDVQSKRLRYVLDKLTRFDSSDRYQSAQQALADLDRKRGKRERQERRADTRGWLKLAAIAAVLIVAAMILLRPEPAPRRIVPERTTRTLPGTPKPRAEPKPEPDAGPNNRSPGCGKPIEQTGLIPDPEGQGKFLYIPENYDPNVPHPLLILIPQRSEPALTWFQGTTLKTLADRFGYIVLAPLDDGSVTFSLGRPQFSSDVQIATSKVVTAQSRLCVDPLRIFVAAQGEGSESAGKLAAEGWVAALAMNASQSMPLAFVPTIMFDGERDLDLQKILGPAAALCVFGTPPPRSHRVVGQFELNRCRGEAREWAIGEHRCRTWECGEPFVSCVFEGGRPWPPMPPRDVVVRDVRFDPNTRSYLTVDLTQCDGLAGAFPVTDAMHHFFESVDTSY